MSTNLGEKAPDRRNNQCKSSDVSTRLEGMKGSVAREHELGGKRR